MIKMKGFSDSLYIVAVHSEFSTQEFQEQTWDLAYKSFVCYALVLNYPLLRQCCVLLVQRITNSFYSRS